jgi:pyruvate dehydrogenase E1 component alpha subunit
MQTYRYRGHSMSDPAKYRTKEEVDKFRNERDPIEQVRKRLVEGRMIDEAGLKEVDGEIRKIVNDAVEFAQHSPEPDPAELWTDILVEKA